MNATSSAEMEDAVPKRIRRRLRNGSIFLLLGLIGGYAFRLMAGVGGQHTAAFKYAGVALVFATIGLVTAGIWQCARGLNLWWKSRTPTSPTRHGFSRFVRALRRDPGQPMHKWPLWQPFIVAAVLTYAAYFDYGVFLAKTHADTPSAEGHLVVESCEPNWTVLGLRSGCTGTITPMEGHFQHGETVRYDAWFSRFDRSDIGRTVEVYDSFEAFRGRTWKGAEASSPPILAELLIGVLALFAFLFWYLFLARAVFRGCAIVKRRVRGRSEDEEQPESPAVESGAAGEPGDEETGTRSRVLKKYFWRYWGVAALLAYAAYFSHGMFVAGDQGGSDLQSVNGHLVLESCEPNWTVLGLRSVCIGTVTAVEGFKDQPNRYDRAFSEFGAADIGKRIPVYLDGGSDWQPKYRESAPRWLGLFVLPLVIGAMVMAFRGVVAALLAIGAARSRSRHGSHGSYDSMSG
ncbi:hypothetical protein [Haloactinomyces albus]|uniref:DUF3592 domain-containing protein n=1 Tax=Haloactinomyces albus TaxID=1352928 RepID=A0AAE3ZBX0_9ACTN|nr:hypothetical protein [Haloactinomyces albus]MDR7301010.1 hypothetical protein [Haloactinomyces albus]